MKHCSKCDTSKPETEYHKRLRSADGLYVWCKTCAREYQSTWYQRNREKVATQTTAWHKANPARVQEMRRKHRYGLDREAFIDMMIGQEGRCAICGVLFETGVTMHLDHDHACCPGDVTCGQCLRAALCQPCNHGLGAFRDRCDLLAAACEYLIKHEGKAVTPEPIEEVEEPLDEGCCNQGCCSSDN